MFSAITSAADSVLADFAGSTNLGELSYKVQNFASSVNDSKGLILDLKTNLKDIALNKIDQVASNAIDRNIDFNIDPSISNAIYDLKYGAISAIDAKIGKHIYPKTETFGGE